MAPEQCVSGSHQFLDLKRLLTKVSDFVLGFGTSGQAICGSALRHSWTGFLIHGGGRKDGVSAVC